MHAWPQVGATDSEDEAESGEDLDRIEAAAAAINQRLPPSPAAQPHEDIQVCHCSRRRKKRKEKTSPFGVKLTRSLVIYRPAQAHVKQFCIVLHALHVRSYVRASTIALPI